MLDKQKTLDQRKQESASIVKQLIKEGKIIKPESERSIFFINKSIESINTAKRLLIISEDDSDALSSYMWVVNISYYSMFFAAQSLLAHFGYKINEERGIHKLTYHALVYFFLVDDNKLQKHFIEEYCHAFKEAEELMNLSEQKALSLVQDFDFEQFKRKTFTYDMGEIAEANKAKTSFNRANNSQKETAHHQSQAGGMLASLGAVSLECQNFPPKLVACEALRHLS